MICMNCKAAGILVTTAPGMTSHVRKLHEHCKGGCDCQHVAKSVLSEEAKREG
jgi:hypothetical protein